MNLENAEEAALVGEVVLEAEDVEIDNCGLGDDSKLDCGGGATWSLSSGGIQRTLGAFFGQTVGGMPWSLGVLVLGVM